MRAHPCTLIAAALFAGASLAGCGNSQEKATEKFLETSISSEGADVDVAMDSQGEQVNITTTTEAGTVNMSVGAGSQVPADFPTDVPLYPKLNILVAHAMVEQENFTIQGSVADPVAKVAEFYRAETEKQGWKQESVTNFPEMENYIYKKGNRTLTVSIVGSEGETSVSITATRE